MGILIADISALELWDKGLRKRIVRYPDVAPEDFLLSASQRRQINPGDYGVSGPIRLVALGRRIHHSSARWHYSYWDKPLPPHSIAQITDDIYVATPEFCFLRMAPKLGFYDAVKLGMELCGRYSTLVAPGQDYRQRPPLTSGDDLRAYLDAALGADSRSIARHAARHILDGAESPGETATAMELCLPFRHGGFGFEAPELNKQIELTPDERKATGRRNLRCDLYWEKHAMACEYFGKEAHEGAYNVQRDSVRENILYGRGIMMIPVSHAALMEAEQMEPIAQRLARRMNRRLRLPQDFGEKQAHARDEIMRGGRCSWLK